MYGRFHEFHANVAFPLNLYAFFTKLEISQISCDKLYQNPKYRVDPKKRYLSRERWLHSFTMPSYVVVLVVGYCLCFCWLQDIKSSHLWMRGHYFALWFPHTSGRVSKSFEMARKDPHSPRGSVGLVGPFSMMHWYIFDILTAFAVGPKCQKWSRIGH